jgi:hypothetical protein
MRRADALLRQMTVEEKAMQLPALYDVYARPFEAAIRLAGLGSVMASYSEFEGVPIHVSPEVLTKLLRGRMGFTGTVVSDYVGVGWAQTRQLVAASPEEVGSLALAAGMDVELRTAHIARAEPKPVQRSHAYEHDREMAQSNLVVGRGRKRIEACRRGEHGARRVFDRAGHATKQRNLLPRLARDLVSTMHARGSGKAGLYCISGIPEDQRYPTICPQLSHLVGAGVGVEHEQSLAGIDAAQREDPGARPAWRQRGERR